MNKLSDKNIIITGALGLIGKKISESLALSGAKVIMLDLKSNKEFKSIKEFKKIKDQILYIQCDVTNEKNISVRK
jgi:NAD(P)-dependent dehydrogenase (short-subunit alcohol dehydrogenase family)